MLFKKGFDLKLASGFIIPGVLISFAGAWLSVHYAKYPLKRILEVFLILYVGFIFFRRGWKLPKSFLTAAAGGTLSGFFAGLFGVGGAVRGAFLSAFDLPKSVYVFTSGLIAFFVDITRLAGYLLGGTRLPNSLEAALIICVPVSLLGAVITRIFLDRLPQNYFRLVVAVFLAAVALKLLLYP